MRLVYLIVGFFTTMTIRKFFAVLFAAIGLVSGTLGIYQFVFDGFEQRIDPAISIAKIIPNPTEPDVVTLENTGSERLIIGGFQICEHEFREDEKNCCTLPSRTEIDGGGKLSVTFYNPSKQDHREQARVSRENGGITCTGFSVSVGEIVEVFDTRGGELDSKVAE